MVLTEFEKLLHSATKDETKVPDELNRKLMKKVNNKYRFRKMRKAIPTSLAACLILGVVLGVAIHNENELTHLPVQDKSSDNGIVISSNLYDNKQESSNETIEKINEELKDAKEIKTVQKEKKAVKSNEKDVINEKTNSSVQTAEVVQDNVVEETTPEMQPMASSSGGGGGSALRIVSLYDYLDGDEELILSVSEKIKEKILNSSDGIEYFEDFSRISGNERFYLTEENELVVIFEPGTVAKEENGEIYFNVGIIK